jgi:hypothetical protein
MPGAGRAEAAPRGIARRHRQRRERE